MVIAADQHNRLPRINHFCDIPEILFGRSRLVFQDHLFILYTALRQNIMHDIRLANLKEQGFTLGTNQSGYGITSNSVLNTERLWQDKNAPQWGAGK